MSELSLSFARTGYGLTFTPTAPNTLSFSREGYSLEIGAPANAAFTLQTNHTVALTVADKVVLPDLSTPSAGSTSFLPTPDLTDDTDATYFYWAWEDQPVGTVWYIRRTLRADASYLSATYATNPAYADLTAAWAARDTLTYA